MTEPTPAALHFDGVTRRFGAQTAVDRVDCRIAPHAFVALVGESGSGKSTLLKTVNRLILPDEGRVWRDGVDVASRDAGELRREIGYVFQGVGLFPHLTVAENIAMPARLRGNRMAHTRLVELLDMVELPADLATRYPAQLSGGQRQRIGVARALASEAKLLLMDEPFGALDPVTRAALGKRVRDLHDRLGLTTIMVTHDMAEALLLATRILVMAEGRIVADETPDSLMRGAGGTIAQDLVAIPRDQARQLAAFGS